MRMAGLMAFWTAIIVMGFLYAVSPYTGGLALLVMLCLVTYRRQQVRQLFGMNSGGMTTMGEDCCVYIFCSCCAIVQEARQLEEAYAVGYPLQIKAPMAPPMSQRPLPMPSQRLPSQVLTLPSQPLQSQRIEYMQPQASQRLVEPQYQAQRSMPQASWGQAPQQQPVMQQPTYLQPSYSQQSLPPVSQSVIRPPQSMQSLPPVQYQQQPQFASNQQTFRTPTGSMQSMPPTNYQQ